MDLKIFNLAVLAMAMNVAAGSDLRRGEGGSPANADLFANEPSICRGIGSGKPSEIIK